MNSIFTNIIKGFSSAYKVAEDKKNLAFLDKFPLKLGHTLVIPKKQVDKLYDLDYKDFIQLMLFVYKLSKIIEKVIPCKRIGLAVIGFEIQHAHVHLIPIDSENDLNFSNSRLVLSEDNFLELSNRISCEFKKHS